MAKTILNPFQCIQYGNMSSGVVTTGTVTDVRRIDNIAVQACVSGSPTVTGTLTIQASVDHQFSAPSAIIANNDDRIGSGTWFTVTSSLFSSSFGSGGTGLPYHTLSNFTYPFIRVIFSASGGAGSGSVWISGKSLGS